MNYKYEKEQLVSELESTQQKLSETHLEIAAMTKQKALMRKEGRKSKNLNYALERATARRERLKRDLITLNEKIRYAKGQIKNFNTFSQYFIEVCKRDFDAETFEYLLAEAKKLKDKDAA